MLRIVSFDTGGQNRVSIAGARISSVCTVARKITAAQTALTDNAAHRRVL